MLDRAAILAKRPKRITLRVDEWDDEVMLEAMTIRRRIELLDAILVNQREVQDYQADQELAEDERAGLAKVEALDTCIVTLIYSIVNEDGSLMFTMDDYSLLEGLSYQALTSLWLAAQKLNNAVEANEVPSDLKKSLD